MKIFYMYLKPVIRVEEEQSGDENQAQLNEQGERTDNSNITV